MADPPLSLNAAPYYDDLFGTNILALDGGGIYGLTEALLLRKLCESCEWFLGGDDVQVFAGCSAGAINALLLAQYERPREAVLAGELEAFWQDAGTFSNTNPVEASLSYFGVTPWFSDGDFLHLLGKYFGERTLDDLCQHVVVTTFNWVGGKPDFSGMPPHVPWPFTMLRPEAYAPYAGKNEAWGPLCFHNFTPPEGWDAATDPRGKDYLGPHYRLVDVAYAAAAPPGLRRMRGGIGDGGSFNANPAMTALGVTKYYIDFVRRHSDFEVFLRQEAMEGDLETPGQVRDVLDEYKEEYRDPSLGNAWSLDKIAVFSIGSGQAMPSSFLRDVDLGPAILARMPTNPANGVFYPTGAYAVDPATLDAELVCRRLLTHHFHRLNPPILPMPTLVAVYLSRFPWMLRAFVKQIHDAVETNTSRDAITEALGFLETQWRLPRPIDAYKADLIHLAKHRVYERFLLAADRIILGAAQTCWNDIPASLRSTFLVARATISEAVLEGDLDTRPTRDEWKAARMALCAVIDAIPQAHRAAVAQDVAKSPQLVKHMAAQFRITVVEFEALSPGILELLKVFFAPRIMEMTLRLLQSARHIAAPDLVRIYDNLTKETVVAASRTMRARQLFRAEDPVALANAPGTDLGDLVVRIFEGRADIVEVLGRNQGALALALGADLASILLEECTYEPSPASLPEAPSLTTYTL
jgi:hypothetical protein